MRGPVSTDKRRRAHLGCRRLYRVFAAVLVVALAVNANATTRWEDYQGNSNVGADAPGPYYPNYLGTDADKLAALRAISADPGNAVRTGTSADIDHRNAGVTPALCNIDEDPGEAGAACAGDAMGRVIYALIRFPDAGSYTISAAHDDQVDLDLSSDYTNTSYRNAVYDIAVGNAGSYTDDESDFETLGSFTSPAPNRCALLRLYWNNDGGRNYMRLRWTTPTGSTALVPSAMLFDPSDPTSATAAGCSGSITGSGTTLTLNKAVGGAGRVDASDQFTVAIANDTTNALLSLAATSGSGIGQQASTGATVINSGVTYRLTDAMSAGSASSLGAYDQTIACTRNGVPFVPDGTAPSWSVMATAANQAIICTISNTALPTLVLRKATVDAAGGPFEFILGNARQAAGSVTTTAANTPTQVDGDPSAVGVQAFTVAAIATPITITEVTPSTWVIDSVLCTSAGMNVGSLSGTTYTIPAASVVSGAAFTCTFTNKPRFTDLAITKIATATQVMSGDPVVFTLEVDNRGPSSADGAFVHDPVVPGLDCTALTCAASGGAQCPAALSVPALQAAPGLAIPVLPSGAKVSLALTCMVTATGQ